MHTKITYLGTIRANPNEYRSRYEPNLYASENLPQYVKEIPHPQGLTLAADEYPNNNNLYELDGDVHALNMIDLDQVGLGEYRAQLSRFVHNSYAWEYFSPQSTQSSHNQSGRGRQDQQTNSTTKTNSSRSSNTNNTSVLSPDELVDTLFGGIEATDPHERISMSEAEKLVVILNRKMMGKEFSQEELMAFFANLNVSPIDNSIDLEELKRGWEKELSRSNSNVSPMSGLRGAEGRRGDVKDGRKSRMGYD